MIVLRRIWWWYLDQMQAKGAKEAPTTVWTLIKKQKRFSPPAMLRLLCLLLILTSKTLVSRVSNFFWPSPSGSDSHSQSASSSPSAPVFLWSFLGITYFLLRPLKRSVPISTRVQVPSALQGTLCLVSNQCIFILCFPLSCLRPYLKTWLSEKPCSCIVWTLITGLSSQQRNWIIGSSLSLPTVCLACIALQKIHHCTDVAKICTTK